MPSVCRRLRLLLVDELLRNSAFSVAQALVSLGANFYAYRLLVQHAGLDMLGLWTLLSAGSMTARLADISGAGGLARFVAEARSDGQNPSIQIHTVVLSTLLFNAIFALALLFGFEVYINRFVENYLANTARALVPFTILSVGLLLPLSTALMSALDGMQRADIRARIVILSFVLYLIGSAILIPYYGIWGFAASQIAQQTLIIIGCWTALRQRILGLGFAPYRWSLAVFRLTVGFGLKLQVNAFAGLLSDPLAKLFLNHWGGTTGVGLYELGSRLVLGIRALTVQAAQPLTPAFAGVGNDRVRLQSLLSRSIRYARYAGFASLAIVAAASPVYSYIMLGRFSPELIWIIVFLALGYGINALSVPHYFLGIGRGLLRWNIISQIAMSLCIIVGGVFLGPIFGSAAIVGAIVVGLILGAAIVWWGNSQILAGGTET